MPRSDQPNLATFAPAVPDAGALDTANTDPIDGTPIRAGVPRQAVDMHQVVGLFDWGT